MTIRALPHLRHVAFVLDTSQSARASLRETCRAFLEFRALLPPHASVRIYLLGRETPLSDGEIARLDSQDVGWLPSPCSLIAPAFRHMIEHGPPVSALILIGNGEVFDLEDWAGHFLVESWALVRTGPDPLQKPSCGLAELSAERLPEIAELLRPQESFGRLAEPLGSGVSDLSSFHWRVDRTGYPMLHVEPLGCFVHLFPVTRTQFEKFISSAGPPHIDDGWYAARLRHNPRVSYRRVWRDNYEGLFATGVALAEAEAFASWLGEGDRPFSLLDAEEWKECYRWLRMKSVTAPPPQVKELSALAVWQFIQTQLSPPDSGGLALMSGGLMEWVGYRGSWRERPFCGLGLPRPHFATQPFRTIFQPYLPNVDAPLDFGFRLRTTR